MTGIFVFVILSILILLRLENRRISCRLQNVENELAGRVGNIDDQISEIGASVVVLEKIADNLRNQGIRALNRDYNGELFDSKQIIVPQPFADGTPYRDLDEEIE